MNAFFRKLRWLTQRRNKEAELREELEFHLGEEADERREEGLAEDEARRAARRELGNVVLVEEDTRAAWGWTIVEQLGQDLRYAFRTMAANRLFTMLAVLSLALGIGANTAIYSFMDAILLRSLPVADAGSLVVLNWHTKQVARDGVMHGMSGTTWDDAKTGTTAGIFPYPVFELFRKNDALFSSVFGHCGYWQVENMNVLIKGQAELANGWDVSGDFFRGLGVAPGAGRLILPDDDRPGAPPVAVASYGYSQRRFGSAANAVGQAILINKLPFTVIGVTPPEFFGVDPSALPDMYLPMHTNELLGAGHQYGFRPEDYLEPNYYWVHVMARLRPGVTMVQAQAALAPAFHQWVASTARTARERADLPELVVREGAAGLDTLRRLYSKPLFTLMTLVGLILALACANVANLMLARATTRRREIAIRLSVGAGRSRVIRQLLTESVLVASMGGALGVLFAIWGMRFLTVLLSNGNENSALHAELNWHVLAAAAALSILTGIIFGLAPALESTRVDVVSALKATRAARPNTSHSLHGWGMSRPLMAGQIAIALVMLVAAGLFVRTLTNLHSIDLGFNRENLLLFRLDARKAGHKSPEIAEFYAELRRQFSAIPGVRGASLSRSSLLGGEHGREISVSGQPANPSNRFLTVGPAFFATMQIPVLSGREFEERDRPGSTAVAVINEAFVKANLAGRNPLGQTLILHEGDEGKRVGHDMEIVGVTRDARYGSLKRAVPPVVYVLYSQGHPEPDEMVYELRTAGDPLQYVRAVREIVHAADEHVPVSEIRTQAADVDRTIYQEIIFAELCSAFAILALVIACVGLYGTVSYNVARRTGEIGIRMALGAQRAAVVRMVLREVLVLATVGLVAGTATALAASKFVASFLFGMKHDDPVAFIVSAVTLLGAALAAGYLPARKAARIDPMAALRCE